MRSAIWIAALCAGSSGWGCGSEDETEVFVEVDLSAYTVPQDVDVVRILLLDSADAVLIQKRFVLEAGIDNPARFRLFDIDRLQKTVRVRADVLKAVNINDPGGVETLVARTEVKEITFRDGESQTVSLTAVATS